MDEIKLKRLILLIMEIFLIQKGGTINYFFTYYLNDFIYTYYQNNKKLFEVIYDNNLLEQCIENNWEIISLDQLIKLYETFGGMDNYLNLLEEVGKDADTKINDLALLFIEYYNNIVTLINATSTEKTYGYYKIPQ